MARPIIRRLLQVFYNRGPWGFCVLALQKVGGALHVIKTPILVAPSSTHSDTGTTVDLVHGSNIHPFDLAYGTDTSGLIWGEDLPTGHRNDIWSTAYYGISPSLFTHALSSLSLDWQRFTFLDVGSGKGRALLLASRFPFKRIVGVELSPQLSAAAAANIPKFSAPWQQSYNIEAHNGDALAFDFPAGPFVLYLYNPFLPPVLKRFLKNLNRSLTAEPREFHLIYFNPGFERLLKKYIPGIQRQWGDTIAMAEEDALADRFGSSQEEVVVYRYLPPT
ncbi:MAG: SAM-dependent methyltransferase [Edaphobacter sp.]|nr:SAM-dependent methyltransferase [Edaphobacter sp.]